MARFTPGTIKVGQTATLEIDISNPKTNPALFRGVALNEVLLSGLTGPTGTQTACGGNLALTAPNRIVLIEAYITPGTTCTLTIPVTATAPGTYVQQVSTLTTLGHSWTNIAPATLTVTSSSSAASPAAPGQSTATTPAATPSAVPSDSAAVSTASESPSPTASASASASTEASPSSGPADPGSSQPVPPTSLVIVILGLAAVALLGGFGVWWFRIRT